MSEGLVTAYTTAFQNIASDASTMLGIIIPIALSIAGVVWVAKRAFGWFKSLGNNGRG